MMQVPVSEHTTLVSIKPKQSSGKPEEVVCEYCKKPRHTNDRCWKLNPNLKPEKFKTGKKVNAHVATTSHHSQTHMLEGNSFAQASTHGTSDVMEKLRGILIHLEKSGLPTSAGSHTPSSAFAKLGTTLACHASSSSSWIIEIGASDHMTGSKYGEDD
ncbi:PREDICTED: uncharacterized protein LOC104586933 [Nelumbo nucifera]|uniref:Uncharacterized protein LOC104586933 n=1 Tax=Nelumbo nucifera TaxID=4432 RepID=A0A1U7Z5D0_NELNU|nr:PREDICTED: uncharacterized protein LOC104586933 [Nelumbo nucifera]